ncbi:uncharacterized protein LOC105702586 isoform X2 [Orussus abietinus]|uniref:uncharacterized protein LOC105702586 isoform X2 n=1 Tax=Orussus abietinus TaxID=222816 RepID=UPI000626ECDE|nr:uncharacterized protein LOC105702586 isoform X2 [Orussus abietinus]
MSEEDLWIRDLVTTYGAVLVFVSSVIFYFSWRWPKLRGAILRAHLQGFETECAELMTPYKKQLFKDLDEITSKDEILRSLGRIRILEIGVKMGDNIRYYPNEAHLICVDWNRKLSEYLVSDKKSWQFGKVVLERLIIGDGTSLKDVTSGCVDVVVTCRSLCSTSSLPQTLREIRRILARAFSGTVHPRYRLTCPIRSSSVELLTLCQAGGIPVDVK